MIVWLNNLINRFNTTVTRITNFYFYAYNTQWSFLAKLNNLNSLFDLKYLISVLAKFKFSCSP